MNLFTIITAMKGIVFTALNDIVEANFGDEIADEVLSTPGLSTGGAFTAVGTYPFSDLLAMVTTLHKATGVPVEQLIQTFGEQLFPILLESHRPYLQEFTDSFQLLEAIEENIHVEVRKLYPEAELPSFSADRLSDNKLHLEYRSNRPLKHLALGLIISCGRHFSETLRVSETDFSTSEQTEVHFLIERG